MSILTVSRQTTTQEQIFNLLSASNWEDCKQEIKTLYQAAKHGLTEEDQEELLLEIYIDALPDNGYSEYWNYMTK